MVNKQTNQVQVVEIAISHPSFLQSAQVPREFSPSSFYYTAVRPLIPILTLSLRISFGRAK